MHRCWLGWGNELFIRSSPHSLYHSGLHITAQNGRKNTGRNTIQGNEATGWIVLTWIPKKRSRSVTIAGRRESFPLSVSRSSLLQQNPQTGRQKGKGRVCLGEEGDSKEEEKRKEETEGSACVQHWPEDWWEELKNPIACGGGREYAKGMESQELTEGNSLSGAKGFGFQPYHPVPLKGQRMHFITFKVTKNEWSVRNVALDYKQSGRRLESHCSLVARCKMSLFSLGKLLIICGECSSRTRGREVMGAMQSAGNSCVFC